MTKLHNFAYYKWHNRCCSTLSQLFSVKTNDENIWIKFAILWITDFVLFKKAEFQTFLFTLYSTVIIPVFDI